MAYVPSHIAGNARWLTDKQRELIERASVLGREKFAPRAAKFDREAVFPFENYADLREAGLLGVCVPEAYGGLGSNKATIMIVSEGVAWGGSFAVTHGAQAGIGTLPIAYYGTPAQKAEYLPRLATGELLSCYALTETGSGSDALAAATTAVLSPDGQHYVLNGAKQFITNAAYADICILFAKIDGEKFTCFIVILRPPRVLAPSLKRPTLRMLKAM